MTPEPKGLSPEYSQKINSRQIHAIGIAARILKWRRDNGMANEIIPIKALAAHINLKLQRKEKTRDHSHTLTR